MTKIHREDNTFVITKNGMPYHVLGGMQEYAELREEYAANPENFTEEYSYKPTLKEIKKAACEKINVVRKEKETAGFTYMGKVFDSDDVSLQRLLYAAQSAALNPDFMIEWTLKDNSIIQLDAAKVQEAVEAFCIYNNALHQKAILLKEAINLAEDAAGVREVSWENT